MTKARDIASAAPAPAGVTSTELGYVDGVTSAIQTQMDTKAATSHNHDTTYINQSTFDAKGDLIAGTGNDAYARLAVGNNGETLVADSAASTGLRYQGNYAAGKNKIINGDFNINQRAFSSSTGAFNYVFDRFASYYVSGTTTSSVQTFTPGAAPVAGYEATNFARLAVTGQTGGTAQCVFFQNIEDVRTFAGQTITVSFWAKANTGTPKIGVSVSQAFGTGGSPSATVFTSGGSATLSTSWARYSLTFAVPSILGKTIGTTLNTSYIQITLVMSDAANVYGTSVGTQSATFDVWGIQAEAGSVATAFQTATGTIQGELAACQRYFWQVASGSALMLGSSFYFTSTQAEAFIQYPVTMRTTPVLIATSGANYYRTLYNGGLDAFDSLTINAANNQNTRVYNNTEVSGAAGSAGVFFTNNASSSVAFSAEL